MFKPSAPGTSAGETEPQNTRPDGELIWCHATEAEHAEIALRLVDRLSGQRPDVHLLVTTAPGITLPNRQSVSARHVVLSSDGSSAARAFLDLWRPDIGLWTAGNLRSTLLGQAKKSGVPLFLVDANSAHLAARGWDWLSFGQRATLRCFSAILARDDKTAQAISRRMGPRGPAVSAVGPLQQDSRPLPYNETDREELSQLLRGRPVWLAAHLQPEEINTILSAHTDVVRASHRTILAISPERDDMRPQFEKALQDSGFRFITWSDGALPDENTQVILADTSDELGLWYRVAPISFMGTSLINGATGSDPNEPAAHGSAILYGPYVRHHLQTYSRFAEAGAARIVRDSRSLAAAVQRIIPADQSAAMAHAAWDVATQSAAVIDQLVQIIADTLDRKEAT